MKYAHVCIVPCMSKPLTTADAAALLGVTRWRVNALIRDGRLKAMRVGQIFLIEERDLKAVAERTPGRPPKVKVEATNGQATPTKKRAAKASAKKGGK